MESEKKENGDVSKVSSMTTETHVMLFKDMPISSRLELALSQIRDIMEREGLELCFLRADRKIFFINQGVGK